MTCLGRSLLARRLTPVAILIAQVLPSTAPQVRADIPWPEVVQRLANENDKLARRPQGHNGEYFVVCTLYYTPKESGFTFERGFDATPVTKPGLHGRKYPRDFLRSVKKEGFGRITTPVNGRYYITLQRRRFVCVCFRCYGWRRCSGAALFGSDGGRARWLASRSSYRDNVPRTSENLREQPLEDHGYRRRSAAMANRLLFRRR